MEWGLSNFFKMGKKSKKQRLNPCSNGMGIELLYIAGIITSYVGLNPCSNGMGIERLLVSCLWLSECLS